MMRSLRSLRPGCLLPAISKRGRLLCTSSVPSEADSLIFEKTSIQKLIEKSRHRAKSLYEPVFENVVAAPSFELVNVRLRGYDFVVLEHYQSYVHKLARSMGFKVVCAWATPARTHNVTLYKPQSKVVMATFDISKYERNVQIADLPAAAASLLFDVVNTNLPLGVELTVKLHEEADDDIRHIPDSELKQQRLIIEEVEKELKRVK